MKKGGGVLIILQIWKRSVIKKNSKSGVNITKIIIRSFLAPFKK
jgi:hypothetical protein